MIRNIPKIENFDLVNFDNFQPPPKNIVFRAPKIPDFLIEEVRIDSRNHSRVSHAKSSPSSEFENFGKASELTSPISQLSSKSTLKSDEFSLNETDPELVEIFSRKVSEEKDQFPLYFIDEDEYNRKLEMGKTDVRTPRQLQAAMVENKQLDHLKQPSQSDDFVLINVRDTHDDVYDNSKGAPTHSHIEFDQFHFLPPVQAAATEEEIERDGIQSRRIWQSPNSFPEPIFNNQIPQFNHRAGNIEHGLDHSRVTHEIPGTIAQN